MKAVVTCGFCAMILFFGACGGDDDELDVDCSGAVPSYTELQSGALMVCLNCHSSSKTGAERADAPANVNFDTYEAARAHAHKAAEEVDEGEMPPRGFSISGEERNAIVKWGACGAPE